jgi:hydroxyacylglutathione hydrolase
MGLSVEAIPAGPLDTNAYLVSDDATASAIVIDAPPGVISNLQAAIARAGVRVEQIVITHAHWDHIVDAAALRTTLGVPLVAHPLAKDRLAKPGSMTTELPFTISPVTPDAWLDEGDSVRLGAHTFAVLHLPGHDPAHIVLYSEADHLILGGDVFFPGGHGTTEIPLADQAEMDRSLARLAALPDDVTVYPGHGLPTTIGAERAWLDPIAARAR